jgi:heme exporter protein D
MFVWSAVQMSLVKLIHLASSRQNRILLFTSS